MPAWVLLCFDVQIERVWPLSSDHCQLGRVSYKYRFSSWRPASFAFNVIIKMRPVDKQPFVGEDRWIRLKLIQMHHEGMVINPNLIPSLEHDDVLQIRPIGSAESSVYIQYKKNVSSDVRAKENTIMVCSRILEYFQNRKDKFPQKGDIEVRKVEKESVCCLFL